MQPSLFPAEPIDRAALAELAARAIPRAELARTHSNQLKSSDLFELGYSVSHWIIPGVIGSEVLEFNPIAAGPHRAELPRLTASDYATQKAIHEAIGARVVSPGRKFSR